MSPYQRTKWPNGVAEFVSLVNPLATYMLGDSAFVEIQASLIRRVSSEKRHAILKASANERIRRRFAILSDSLSQSVVVR